MWIEMVKMYGDVSSIRSYATEWVKESDDTKSDDVYV